MSPSLDPKAVDDTIGELVTLKERDSNYPILDTKERSAIDNLVSMYRGGRVDRNELVLVLQQILGRDKSVYFLSDEERASLKRLRKRLVDVTPRFSPARQRLITLGLAGGLVVSGVGYGGYRLYESLTQTSVVTPVNRQPLPAPPEIPLTATDRQKVVTGLGSFSTIAPAIGRNPDTQAPAVLLLREDGSIAASVQWTVPFTNTSWSKQDIIQLTAATRLGNYANLQTDQGRTYEVRLGQPFVLEETPGQVMLIDQDGFQWQISTGRAIALRLPLHH